MNPRLTPEQLRAAQVLLLPPEIEDTKRALELRQLAQFHGPRLRQRLEHAVVELPFFRRYDTWPTTPTARRIAIELFQIHRRSLVQVAPIPCPFTPDSCTTRDHEPSLRPLDPA